MAKQSPLFIIDYFFCLHLYVLSHIVIFVSATCTLEVSYVETYPDVAPNMTLVESENITDEQLDQLKELMAEQVRRITSNVTGCIHDILQYCIHRNKHPCPNKCPYQYFSTYSTDFPEYASF